MGAFVVTRDKQGFRPAEKPASGAQVIEQARKTAGGFLKDTDVAVIAADPATRLQMLLVRCGNGRFMAPAQDVKHFIDLIERPEGDYVRDVSLPAGQQFAPTSAEPAHDERFARVTR